MAEPITLAALGATALAQGITFLYSQATEILKRRRERKDAERAGEPTPVAPSVNVELATPVLAGRLRPGPVDESVLDEREEELFELTERLGSYANGLRTVDVADAQLVARAEALRGLLELAYRQRITFKGEHRDQTGATIDVTSVAKYVDGELTIADIKQVRDGSRVTATSHVDEVGPDAHVTVFRGDVIGG